MFIDFISSRTCGPIFGANFNASCSILRLSFTLGSLHCPASVRLHRPRNCRHAPPCLRHAAENAPRLFSCASATWRCRVPSLLSRCRGGGQGWYGVSEALLRLPDPPASRQEATTTPLPPPALPAAAQDRPLDARSVVDAAAPPAA